MEKNDAMPNSQSKKKIYLILAIISIIIIASTISYFILSGTRSAPNPTPHADFRFESGGYVNPEGDNYTGRLFAITKVMEFKDVRLELITNDSSATSQGGIDGNLKSGFPVTAGNTTVIYEDTNENGELDSEDIFTAQNVKRGTEIRLFFIPTSGEITRYKF